jgi:hypothetical protein
MSETTGPSDVDVVYCTVHPATPTSLRCNKCERPMCTRCAVLTPVGYRCRECVRNQQAIFFSAQPLDPLIQIAVCVPLSAIAATIISVISFGFYLIYLIDFAASSFAGALIANLAYRAVGKRRGRYSWLVVAAAIVAGALVPVLLNAAVSSVLMSAASVTQMPPVLLQMLPIFVLAGAANLGWWIYLVVGTGAAIGFLRFGR